MKTNRYFKAESRKDWYVPVVQGDPVSNEIIKLGAILRIADALEKLVKPPGQIEREAEQYRECWNNALRRAERAERKLAATRGVVTKLKNKERKNNGKD